MKSGVTLVEVLVGIVIVGILVAMVLPAILRAGSEGGDIETRNVDGWERLGALEADGGDCTIFRRRDPKTGDTIYVAIGRNGCGLFVVGKKR